MSIEDQASKLSQNAIVVASYYTLHGDFSSTCPYHDKIGLVCSPFDQNPSEWTRKIKHTQLCESDMIDCAWSKSEDLGIKEKKYDLLIITEFSKKGLKCKGLSTMALIEDIVTELKLKVALVDIVGRSFIAKMSKNNTDEDKNFILDMNKVACDKSLISRLFRVKGKKPPLNSRKLNKLMQSSRVMICGNTNDASPKIISEAIIRGLPVILNKNILGGQKYINESTGVLFDGPKSRSDVFDKYEYYKNQLSFAIQEALSSQYNLQEMRNFYYKNYGLKRVSRRLARNIKKRFGIHSKYAFYPQFRSYFLSGKIK